MKHEEKIIECINSAFENVDTSITPPPKKLDVIIITKLKNNLFFNCINSIIKNNDFINYNFYICYTGENLFEVELIKTYCDAANINYNLITDDYNFAKNCNRLVSLGKSDYLLFINDDVELKDNAVDQCLYEFETSKLKLGTVGIKLLYPNGKIQCCGQYLKTINGRVVGAGHYLQCKENTQDSNTDFIVVGNTFAFVMMKRDVFNKIGLLDERFNKCFEDVLLNVKLYVNGYLNICKGTISAIHYESVTRKESSNTISKDDIMLFCRESTKLLHFNFETPTKFKDTLKKYMEKQNEIDK